MAVMCMNSAKGPWQGPRRYKARSVRLSQRGLPLHTARTRHSCLIVCINNESVHSYYNLVIKRIVPLNVFRHGPYMSWRGSVPLRYKLRHMTRLT